MKDDFITAKERLTDKCPVVGAYLWILILTIIFLGVFFYG